MAKQLSVEHAAQDAQLVPQSGGFLESRVFKGLLCVLVIGALVWLSRFLPGVDYQPLGWALKLALAGHSAYGSEMQGYFDQMYGATRSGVAGFAYPLPAVWLALPWFAFSAPVAKAIWCVMAFSSVGIGMLLLRVPPQCLLFVPLLWGMSELQSTVLLCGLLLIGIWALREQRWWLLGLLIALTLTTKPQTTLILAGALAIAAFRARAWRPALVCTLVAVVPTFALEPGWVQAWLASVAHYDGIHKTMWFIAWLPVSALLLWRRQTWSGLAVLQMALFPVVTHPYTLLPLLIGYVDMRRRWLGWFAIAGSWLNVLIPTIGPLWLFVGVCYLPPLIIDALWSLPTHQHTTSDA